MTAPSPVATAAPSVPLGARVVPSMLVGLGAFLGAPSTPMGQRVLTAAAIGWLFGMLLGVVYGIALKVACDLLKHPQPAKGWDLHSPPFVAAVLMVGTLWSLLALNKTAERGKLERCLEDASAQGVQWVSPIQAYASCVDRASERNESRNGE